MADVESQSDTPNSSITARPDTLPFSPTSSNASFEDTDGTIFKVVEQQSQYTSKVTGRKREDFEITRLLKDFAENDESYVGFKLFTNTDNSSSNNEHMHPSSMISWERNAELTSFWDDGDVEKDGRKKHMNVLSLRVNDTKKLSVYNNGELLDDMVVSTPTFCQGSDCSSSLPLNVFHHSGPLHTVSVLQLKSDCTPKLVPVENPDDLDYATTVIQYESVQKKGLTTPGSMYFRMESKSHVYLGLDYSEPQNPKLITIKASEMKSKLNEMKNNGNIKIKPIINSLSYSIAPVYNNTALYFKTDKNYYFLYVEEPALHLRVEAVPIECKIDYKQYLHFGPELYLSSEEDEDGPELYKSSEEVDGGAAVGDKHGNGSTTILGRQKTDGEDGGMGDMKVGGDVPKSVVPCSPTSTTRGGIKVGNIILPGQDDSRSTMKLHKTGSDSDSGVDTKSPDGQEEKSILDSS